MSDEKIEFIEYLAAQVANYLIYINVVLLGSFCIVIAYDWTRKDPFTKTSFFIISFVNISSNFIWMSIQLIVPYILINWVAYVLYIITRIAFTFDGWILPVLSFNRFTALIHPVSHNRIWSNKNTVVIISIMLLIIVPLCSFLYIYITDDWSITILGAILALLNLIASIIGLTISIICLLKKNPSLQKNKAKIERKLLLTSLSVTACHCIADAYGQIDRLSQLNINIRIDFIKNAIFYLIFLFFSFGLFGGMVILLFINR